MLKTLLCHSTPVKLPHLNFGPRIPNAIFNMGKNFQKMCFINCIPSKVIQLVKVSDLDALYNACIFSHGIFFKSIHHCHSFTPFLTCSSLDSLWMQYFQPLSCGKDYWKGKKCWLLFLSRFLADIVFESHQPNYGCDIITQLSRLFVTDLW